MLDVQALSPLLCACIPPKDGIFCSCSSFPLDVWSGWSFLHSICPLCTYGPAGTSSVPQSSWEHPSQWSCSTACAQPLQQRWKLQVHSMKIYPHRHWQFQLPGSNKSLVSIWELWFKRLTSGQRWVDFDRKGTLSSFLSPNSETEAHLLNSYLTVGMLRYFKGE